MGTFKQHICSNCLQLLVNGESDHEQHHLDNLNMTLDDWSKTGYTPSGLTENSEPFFSWKKCDLCYDLAGDRYEYYFTQKS